MARRRPSRAPRLRQAPLRPLLGSPKQDRQLREPAVGPCSDIPQSPEPTARPHGMADDAAWQQNQRGDTAEVTLVARGIATAVAPEHGLTNVQADLLEAIASALTGVSVDYRALEPLGPDELAEVLVGRDLVYRRRIVHHMVLGEFVLRPLPTVVAHRVAKYASALGVEDDFVRVARRFAQGAYGLAWMDLQRNGFVEHVRESEGEDASRGRAKAQPFEP